MARTGRGAALAKKSSAEAASQVREAVFSDYSQIAALESRYGLNPKGNEEWSHLWKNNPVYRGLPNWPIGWVVENEKREIVGHIANIPSAYEFRGRSLLAASGRGLVVDERYRSYAFPLFSQFFNQKPVDLIMNTTVNAHGLKLHELFRCHRVPTGEWNRAVFWITDHRNFAAKLAATKEWPLPSVLSYPVSVALSVKSTMHRKPARTPGNGYEISECTKFDQRFDTFWDETRTSHPQALLSVRSSETLNWHFKFALQHKQAFVITVTHNAQLVAYATFLRQDNTEVGLKRMRLVDYQSVDSSAEHLVPMISLALRRCREQKVHMLEAIGFSPEKQRVLARIAPHKRELPCWLYFYRAKDKELAESLQDPSVWDPTAFDGDGSL